MDDGSPRSLRDRAVLVLGFACGFRRSNLHLLHVDEIEFVEAGLVVHERSSKTDQEGKGRDIPLFRGVHPETCPVRALRDWLGATPGAESGELGTATISSAMNQHRTL
jgi:site-specific recombinase XerC